MRCDACKHWAELPEVNPRREGSEHRHCGIVSDYESLWDVEPEDLNKRPFADDLSGMGSLMTPPGFGCVLFEAKP